MRNNGNLKKYLVSLVTVFCIVVFFFAFYQNRLQVADKLWFSSYQEDSDRHVIGRIVRTMETGSVFSEHGFLGFADETGLYQPYFRQVGLQGMYASLIGQVTGANLNDTIRYTRAANALLLAALLTIFLLWVWREFSLSHTAAAFVVLLYSPWLTVSARNLYWATWLLFLPFVLFLLLLQLEEKKGKYSHTAVFFVALFAVFLKSACGYEFISSVLIAMELPFLYYAVKNRWKLKKLLLRAFWAGFGGICGFAAAICLNLYQCYGLLKDFSHAIALFLDNISKRTGLFGIEQADELVKASLRVDPVAVVNTYLTQKEPVLFTFTMSELLIVFLFALLITLACSVTNKTKALFVTAAASVFAPLSWFVLAKGHSFIHMHINYILWSVPVLSLVTLSVFDTAKTACVRAYQISGNRVRRAAVVIVPAAIGIYILVSFYLRGYFRAW